ncbi:hypothetical protein [Sphingomonas sp. ACRSK]|uniref:hypothetical protein n=1 Tax=Sphingomonas sp. ACRSK TaxID=2918213 RepID=UPI001EF51F79|nr:hypothetical protein [Sphingomonas sp. ACRSK]MCG7348954.1 hypothetical protein [Sphingomonas sp. ACRSK]
MKREDAIKELRRLADEAEATGIGQYRRSCAGGGIARSDFGNALHWGRKAREYREAALELAWIKREASSMEEAKAAVTQALRQMINRIEARLPR